MTRKCVFSVLRKLTLVIVLLSLLALLLTTSVIEADETAIEMWVARYDGPGAAGEEACAIAVDGSGNVYVTGRSTGSDTGWDYGTVKYDTDGNQMWAARYNSGPVGSGPVGSEEWARDIAIDGEGNVYVTGYSTGSGYSFAYADFATIKYDDEGNQMWVARYDGPGIGADVAWALGVDDLGNVYVTGGSEGNAPEYGSFATVKYDGAGNEIWVARYDGPGAAGDEARAIAVDGVGNVYVTGESFGSTMNYDYATVKYDSAGNELWVARYNGPADDWEEAFAIGIDGSGSVYVTGKSRGAGGHEDYATVKYDGAGNEIWVARYDGPGAAGDEARAIAVDGVGNVYVTGSSEGDYTTIKYDNAGNQIWVARYDGPGAAGEEAKGIALDSSGNVYVTGVSEGDYATLKYDTSGNQVWVARYDSPANDGDIARDIAVDNTGNVYVTGDTIGSGTGWDYTTVKYEQTNTPNTPSNFSPSYGEPDISLTPTLTSSGFSDPDVGDSHAASQWQITTTPGDYNSPEFDSVSSLDLTSITVPPGNLNYDTQYYWHVRHQDNHGAWSSYSIETSFTTEAPPEGCFIATAAYGTSTAAELDTLRAFRDEVMLESTLGSQLVEWYYQISPPVADFISENEGLRTLVRELLVDPVVWVVDTIETLWRD